jgi:pimeloyl-ACP methyl ester carboxylesterase
VQVIGNLPEPLVGAAGPESLALIRRKPRYPIADQLEDGRLQGRPAPTCGTFVTQVSRSLTGGLRQARIQARTLVLHGGADTVVDPRNGKLLADRIPGARLMTFPELGHLLFWEDPDGFAGAVASFCSPRRRPVSPPGPTAWIFGTFGL